jgi:dihydropteroate synthase
MRPLVMGVLNVTPDSFSDGGRYLDQDRAVEHGLEMVAAGADVIDVGGESSRPGAEPVEEKEELRRVIPVVEALSEKVRVSVDTTKRAVALAAVEAGASLINDISASLWELAASSGAGWIATHMQGSPKTMQEGPRYEDVVSEVREFLVHRAEVARESGVREVWVDPGIGFGKTKDHNLALLQDLPGLVSEGFPVLMGTSRKWFLGSIGPRPDGSESPVSERLEGSIATATWGMLAGVSMVRVHDVGPTVQAAILVGETRLGQREPELSRARSGGQVAGN